MHPIASVYDVMQEIIVYLGPLLDPTSGWYDEPIWNLYGNTYSRKNGRKTLLNVALTCRAFTKPALQTLWWEMETLVPLVRLIPNMETSGPDGFILRGTLTKEDFNDFDRYARRIHYLHRNITSSVDAPGNLLIQISQIRQCTTLLPNLRYFEGATCWAFGLFLNPNLRYLMLTSEDDSYPFRDWVVSISLNASNLQELVIDEPVETDVWPSMIQMRSLRRLMMYCTPHLLGQEFMEMPSLFPNLVELHVDGVTFSPNHQLLSMSPATLPNLARLSVSDISIEQACRLLDIFRLPCLETMYLRILDDIDAPFTSQEKANWEIFFDKLASPRPYLQKLTLCGQSRPNFTEERMSLASFPGLLKLRLLKELSVYYPILQDLSLADIKTIVEAFPELKSLTLKTRTPPSISFDALTTLARGLPNLKYLGIRFTAFISMVPYPLDKIPILNHSLRTLSIMGCETGKTTDFCVRLDRIFPLVIVCGDFGNPLEDQLRDQLSSLRLARMDERVRLRMEG